MQVSLGVPYELLPPNNNNNDDDDDNNNNNNNNNLKTTPVRLFPSISEYTVCLVFMKFCIYRTTDSSLHRHLNIVTYY